MKKLLQRIQLALGGEKAAEKQAAVEFERGRQYYENGDFQHAVESFSQAIQLKPEMAKAYRNRGLSHMALKEDKKALADLSTALRLDPKDPRAFWNRGVIYRKMGEDIKADSDFKMAKRLDPRLAHSEESGPETS